MDGHSRFDGHPHDALALATVANDERVDVSYNPADHHIRTEHTDDSRNSGRPWDGL